MRTKRFVVVRVNFLTNESKALLRLLTLLILEEKSLMSNNSLCKSLSKYYADNFERNFPVTLIVDFINREKESKGGILVGARNSPGLIALRKENISSELLYLKKRLENDLSVSENGILKILGIEV